MKLVLGFISSDISGKIHGINNVLKGYYRDLGLILNNISEDSTVFNQILNDTTDITSQLRAIKALDRDLSKTTLYAPPGLIARYWPILLLVVQFGPSTTMNAWANRREIAQWLKLNFFDTALGFWNNWIVKPIWEMLSILRNDDTITIASKESLQSDLDSLKRMLEDFIKDYQLNISQGEVHSTVAKGDLTMMMSQYEDEIRTPFKSIVKGLLIRSMLIQVQKMKVDGAIAINGIDKLLKLQQLLFGVLSISPSFFILYQGNKALRNKSSRQADLASKRIDCLRSLNQIEKLVNREKPQDKLVGDGKLFVEIVNLTLLAKSVIPSKLRSEFYSDLNELAVTSLDESIGPATGVINRIWNMYSPYFRE
ncbi:NCA2-domain-containing protein [Metschnikowia bicuspidata]|uniref:NCA2-domain-containing protein n=1 Tax=Metschnikowia bicuspidata TaxID=27322 RepID=A0A4P9ZDV0_9ASCO|nr:NCA2-domain-containing protein [Metschnikowia bicuspidata]